MDGELALAKSVVRMMVQPRAWGSSWGIQARASLCRVQSLGEHKRACCHHASLRVLPYEVCSVPAIIVFGGDVGAAFRVDRAHAFGYGSEKISGMH